MKDQQHTTPEKPPKSPSFPELLKNVEPLVGWYQEMERNRLSIERLIGLQVQQLVLLLGAAAVLFNFLLDMAKEWPLIGHWTLFVWMIACAFLLIGVYRLLDAYAPGFYGKKKIYILIEELKSIYTKYKETNDAHIANELAEHLTDVITSYQTRNDEKSTRLYKCRWWFSWSFIMLTVCGIAYMTFKLTKHTL